MTAIEAKSIDLRNYKETAKSFWHGDFWKNYGSRMRFNKNSIVFDNSFKFTIKTADLLENGNYDAFLMCDGYGIYDEVEDGYSETLKGIADMVSSICYYIATRI